MGTTEAFRYLGILQRNLYRHVIEPGTLGHLYPGGAPEEP